MNQDVNVYQAALLTSSVTDAAVKWKTPNKFFTPIIIIFTPLLFCFHTYCSHFTPLLFHFHTYCSHFTPLLFHFHTYCSQACPLTDYKYITEMDVKKGLCIPGDTYKSVHSCKEFMKAIADVEMEKKRKI